MTYSEKIAQMERSCQIGETMPLHLYRDVFASGSVPLGWSPLKDGTIKYPVRNSAVLRHLRQLLAGKWQKVIKKDVPMNVNGRWK
jgi:hypothetical protein